MLEIGTEELPAAYLPGLIDQFGREAQALFAAQHLPVKEIRSFGTPRRLVLIARGLASIQRTPGEEVRGPSKQAAYDKAGKPTPALLGFLRSQGGALERVKIVTSEKGAYVYLIKPPKTTPTAALLPQLLPKLIATLRAPKTMRWDASGVRFARPIRWLLARYGAQAIRWSFGALTGGSRTWVGGPLRPRATTVTSIDGYLRALKRGGILLDAADRRRWIERTVTVSAAKTKAKPAPEMFSHGLLDEVTCLLEHPVPLLGGFDRKFLDLPREVLLASMAKYQRVFAVESQGKVAPTFIAILDGNPAQPQGVRAVIERILNARLADSLLFWQEDRERPIDEMARALSGVTFHERIGSMADKADRLHKLSAVLEEAWGLSAADMKDLRRACQLAKADLVSTMVKEFPTLQGVMGKHYALQAGEPRAVAEAIEEHYLPLAGREPKTLIGSALAILDKYDTLASYCAQGIMPTGDQDPFGLRRAAQGVVEVAWTIHRPLPLNRLLESRGVQQVGERIKTYLLERLYTFAWPSPKPSADYIDAVLSSPGDDLVDIMERIVSLRRLDGKRGLLKAAKVIERTRNILKGAPAASRQVDPARFTEALERQLWHLYTSRRDEVERLTREKSYGEATVVFGEMFFDPLHEFFDRVLVNVPDQALQQNRLALMQAINTLYTERIADLSKLTVLQQHEES